VFRHFGQQYLKLLRNKIVSISRQSKAMVFCLRIDNSSYRLIFYLDKKDEIYHYSSKEHPKISKIAKFWLQNVVKYGKYSPVKLVNFEYFSILLRAVKITTFGSKMVIFTIFYQFFLR
jgi:hypothetical protein